jgi:hypothetical protein
VLSLYGVYFVILKERSEPKDLPALGSVKH